MTGKYKIKAKPLPKYNSWREAKTLIAEMTIDIDGEEKHFAGCLYRSD